MLGSRCEAEDLMQDAYLRWHESKPLTVQCVVAFLVTLTTRLCLDRLRKRKHERAPVVAEAGLCEGLVTDWIASPEMQREHSEEVSLALSAVLNRLGRDERAAFLLHEVFDYEYPELAQILGKAEPACRQIVHRARKRVREPKPRFSATTESRERVARKFLNAAGSGDRQAVLSLIDAEVEYVN
jgi:RNA polymerase sigma-70 factor (ECF subfamily)